LFSVLTIFFSFFLGTVSVITNDGHNFVGVLKGVDQTTNIIVSGCQERKYSDKGVEIVNLGLIFVLRGDNM
jgi:U6 snRNA-associated Sm-like protein LSm8